MPGWCVFVMRGGQELGQADGMPGGLGGEVEGAVDERSKRRATAWIFSLCFHPREGRAIP